MDPSDDDAMEGFGLITWLVGVLTVGGGFGLACLLYWIIK